ncbi:hypothetical protein [Mesorhizobium sp. CA4]|uniref:hypothetical protein n=1 Tax=Mesorhizobium sp. CA4 TaxID=588499 RepID=UPI001CD09FE6|nr:hypothetical protein [Mesorhizobium sp. CA4]MBZ9819113.1 hypothetical protein [Mesorhizobium sp. CA4]
MSYLIGPEKRARREFLEPKEFSLGIATAAWYSRDKRDGRAGEKSPEVVLPQEAWLKISYIL